ncbi:MAG: Peptide chain release factor N(5)-glutamine methyltransferase [uncultured Acetobacteraceae bacterium]|uniref:Release factor glutamine methyltransferase n=1 Tax=uncultured Acetobacteraceae bacterium TaxID=169975 RepID=A0A6J4HWD1_9PROT|nr:MAG: Peptide chain release factor N(5)-glutamine methyltransferase [uncultured Acetobacteraceae bacterium]
MTRPDRDAAAASCADPAGTVGAFLCRAGQHLRAAALDTPRLEARLLLAHALGCRTEDLLREPRAPVPPGAAGRFAALLRRRLEREPMAHLLGTQEFWSLPFSVSAATLIPRPDTETLIEAALAAFPRREAVRRVLDLGTGTGCLLLAALSEFPEATGVGVDSVPDAAALARRNAAGLGLHGRAGFFAGSWAAALAGGRFDLVLSNPPYIETETIAGLAPEVARHEPFSALNGGADGLDAYRSLLPEVRRVLAPHGRAVVELGQGQRAAVEALAGEIGLRPLGCRADLGGVDRALLLASDAT